MDGLELSVLNFADFSPKLQDKIQDKKPELEATPWNQRPYDYIIHIALVATFWVFTSNLFCQQPITQFHPK